MKASYETAEAEKENVHAEIEQLAKKYEALKNKSEMDVSWTFLYTFFNTLNEAHNEAFDINAEFEEAKEATESTQPATSFSTLVEESSEGKVDEGNEDERY